MSMRPVLISPPSLSASSPSRQRKRRLNRRSPPPPRGCRRAMPRAPRACSKRSPPASPPTGAPGGCSERPTRAIKEIDKSLAAYRKALEIEPDSPQLLYNIGTAYAMKADVAAAFEWLGRAKATRKVDMTQIESDPNLSSLKADPRFRALLPTPADFAQPFVEPVHDHPRVGRRGRQRPVRLDRSRRRRRRPRRRARHRHVGADQGDRRRRGRPRLRLLDRNPAGCSGAWTASPGDQLGTGVEAAGDANHDGVPDVVASAPGAGKAYVYSGKDGHVLLTFTAEKSSDQFRATRLRRRRRQRRRLRRCHRRRARQRRRRRRRGPRLRLLRQGRTRSADAHRRAPRTMRSAAPSPVARTKAGSFLIVGAPGAGPRHAGRTYVYKGLSSTPAFVIDADETGSALGAMFLSVVGDVNHDGVPDIYASDFTNAAKGPSTGRVYVHSGADGRRLLTLTGETAGEGFGIGPAAAGDVDGDGYDDLIVGAWQYAGAAISGGRAYLYSGKDGTLLKTYTCRTPGDTFGFDAVGMGDVDGDGTIDFLITSAWSGIHGFHSGRMFIISSGVNRR